MDDRYLFRAKRIDTGEWVEGYLIVDEKDYSKYFIGYVFGTNEDGTPHDLDVVQVDPTTICQCTGLKDKNGKLIFENDIMEAHIDEDFPEDVSRFKVEWNGKGWVENHPDGVDREYLDDFDTEHFKVVGNIFDNPELLEE